MGHRVVDPDLDLDHLRTHQRRSSPGGRLDRPPADPEQGEVVLEVAAGTGR